MNALRQKQAAKKKSLHLSVVLRKQSISEKNTRISDSHNFDWSHKLHKKAANEIKRVMVILVTVYLLIMISGLYYDGYRGVDIPYLIISSITTIGLGDISPSDSLIRGGTILILPFGLLIITFGLALVVEHSQADLPIGSLIQEEEEEFGKKSKGVKEKIKEMRKKMKENFFFRTWLQFKESMIYPLFTSLVKYCLVIFIGATFMLFNEAERREQKKYGNDMTLVDSLYFATVCATTVGYGHEIWPLTTTAKWFYMFYFLFSTLIVGSIIGDLASLSFSMEEKKITKQLLESVIYVHKCDLFNRGVINEAEYVVFKLLQLQQINHDLLHQLCKRYAQLDQGNKGKLLVGVDVPNAAQVERMKSMTDAEYLMPCWKENKEKLVSELGPQDNELKEHAMDYQNQRGDLSQCHDFSWSKHLWRQSAKHIAMVAVVLLIVYCGIQYYVTTEIDDMKNTSIHPWYYVSATLSTVGFGDFAPENQRSRGIAIGTIPFGLIILGFILSFSKLYANSTPERRPRPDMLDTELNKFFKHLDKSYEGKITKAQFIEYVGQKLKLEEKAASEMFDNLDFNSEGVLYQPGINLYFKDSVAGKVLYLILKLYGTIAIGAFFVKFYPSEPDLSWIDAFYFATVAATSVGYGDITPVSEGGQIFFTFYMLIATIIVAETLGEFLDFYLTDIVTSKIHDIVIDSCIYVYTADVDGSGCISEAEYVIFKLRQMQAVDADVLNMLMDHFEELDINNTKSLIIGVNIPSKDQLIELEATVKDPNKEHEKVNAAWRKMKSVVLAEMGLESALEAVDDEDHDEPRSESEAKYKKLSMIAKMYLALQRARGQAKKSLFDVFVDKVEKEEEPPEPSPDRSAARSISMDFAQLELLSLVPTVEVPAIPTSPSLTNMMPDMSGLPGSPSMSSKDITDMMPSTDMMPKLDDLSSMTSGFFSSGSEPSTPKSLGVSL